MLLFKSKVEILKVGRSEVVTDGFRGDIENITFDSRKVPQKSIFFALSGTKTDGHNFVCDAFKNGSEVAVVSKILPQYKDFASSKTIIKVDSPLNFMAELAKEFRKYIKCDVIGITGTIGKTTTKYLLYETLSKKFKILFTPESYNNILGLSYTILNYNNEEKIILEFGINHIGEMDKLVEICRPDIAIITYISAVHLEGMKSIFHICEEKKKIGKYAKTVYLNSNSPLYHFSTPKLPMKITVGTIGKAHYQGTIVEQKLEGIKFVIRENGNSHFFELPVYNRAIIYPALFSYAISKKYGIEYEAIYSAFKHFHSPKLRNQIIQKGNRTIIADCYNASPESVKTAISSYYYSIQKDKAEPIFILGDMLELGELSPFYHRQTASFLSQFNGLKILVGNEFQHGSDFLNKYNIHHYYFKDTEKLLDSIKKIISPEHKYILLKASRKLQLEKLIELL